MRRMEQKPRPWQQPELAWSSDGEGEPGLSEDIWLDKKVVEMLQATHVAAKISKSEGERRRFLSGARNSVSLFLNVSPNICIDASHLVSAVRQMNIRSEPNK